MKHLVSKIVHPCSSDYMYGYIIDGDIVRPGTLCSCGSFQDLSSFPKASYSSLICSNDGIHLESDTDLLLMG